MLAIYKRELKSYMTSMVGYIFIFFILVLAGIYFSAYNISSAYPKFEITLDAITFVFLIGVPILTMNVIAEERKQKTDQMLLTSPVSIQGIVCGKYLALVTVYLVPILILCIYPLVMSKYGSVALLPAYTAIAGFFLLGCANLAVGVFLSSITESQVIAAVLTFIVLFAFYVITGISSFFAKTAISTCATFAILILALVLVFYTMVKNRFLSGVLALVLEGILWVSYLLKPGIFEGGIQKNLTVFDISGHFDDFVSGIFDINGVVYFLSIVGICLFLTVQTIAKRRWS